MFNRLKPLAPDPILSLAAAARADARRDKLDLTIGVYFDDAGITPVMRAVKGAEQTRIDTEISKAYLTPRGDPAFCTLMQDMTLGDAVISDRLATVQTPGGSGAIAITAEMVRALNPSARVWGSAQGYMNHTSTFEGAGLDFCTYPYLRADQGLDFGGMMDCLRTRAQVGDLIILHGCCHNPTGLDFSLEQWDQVTDLLLEKGLIPFLDIAYQGFGAGMDADAVGIRHVAARVPEAYIAFSCSKNFGLYRDRTGGLILLGQSADQVALALSVAQTVARRLYSMPPHHGAELVKTILTTPELAADWRLELEAYRVRVGQIRTRLAQALAQHTNTQDFDFVANQQGMFSLLPLTRLQVESLRQDHGAYLVPVADTLARINVAACPLARTDDLAAKIAEVLRS